MLDDTWKTVTWREVKIGVGSGPCHFPDRGRKDYEFGGSLRNEYLEGWTFAAHWLGSALVTAFSTTESWRKNYNKSNGNGKSRRTKAVPPANIADMLLYAAAD